MLMPRYYHVTNRVDAASILKEGFQGGWGDVGLGVYVYASLSEAIAYAEKGGWDNRLKDPVLLLIEDSTLERVIPDSNWPTAKYENMYWKDLEEEGEEAFWRPASMKLLDDVILTVKPKTPRRRSLS